VHEHEQAAVAGDLHRLEQILVRRVERRALVGHEDLDGGDAEVGQGRQLLLHVVGEIRDRHVQAVVDPRCLRLGMPGVDGLAQRAVRVLEREVDQHRRAAGERRRRARVPVVGSDGAAERHVHVGVPVDEAWHQLRAGDVDHLRAVARQVDADRRDRLVLDRHVGAEGGLGGDDRPAHEDLAHVTTLLGCSGRTPTMRSTSAPVGDSRRMRPLEDRPRLGPARVDLGGQAAAGSTVQLLTRSSSTRSNEWRTRLTAS
jgi:hypothetical protein